MQWEVRIFARFRDAVSTLIRSREFAEFFPAAVVVSKKSDGTLFPSWFDGSLLTAWADSDGWNCWGGGVLSAGICDLENDTSYDLDTGEVYMVWDGNKDPNVPCIQRIEHRGRDWPSDSPTRGRKDRE
jgi:hypothetical protein